MKKGNCWEVKQCGREPGGRKAYLGICPSASESSLDGAHGGKNAGRACWVVAGTQCGGQEQGTFAQKYHNCEKCDFYQSVRKEEGASFTLSVLLLKRMRKTPVLAKKNILIFRQAGKWIFSS